MKKYLPIKIFSIRLGYGWWWGTHFFFFKKKAFTIIPCWLHLGDCTYENGKAIENGDTCSWSVRRQREKEEDKKR
jgi:hypothetical protein